MKSLDEDGAACINIRPEPRSYGIIHQAAWHGKQEVCIALIDQYGANPCLLTKDGLKASAVALRKGHAALAEVLSGYEARLDGSDEGEEPAAEEGTLVISVTLASGEYLVKEQALPACMKIKTLIETANDNWKGEGDVSQLFSTEGQALHSEMSLAKAGLLDGSVITALVTDDAGQLEKIESLFHALIMKRNGVEDKKTLEERNFEFPALKQLIEEHSGGHYYAVPGMYGGFQATIRKDEKGWKLVTESWCRVVDGSGERHEITAQEGTKLVAQGFV